MRISDVERAFEIGSTFGRIFLGGDGVEMIWLLIGVDERRNGVERMLYSLLQMDFKWDAKDEEDDDPGERY